MKYNRNWGMEGLGEAEMDDGRTEVIYFATDNKGRLTVIEFNPSDKDHTKRKRVPCNEKALKDAGVKVVHFHTYAKLTV